MKYFLYFLKVQKVDKMEEGYDVFLVLAEDILKKKMLHLNPVFINIRFEKDPGTAAVDFDAPKFTQFFLKYARREISLTNVSVQKEIREKWEAPQKRWIWDWCWEKRAIFVGLKEYITIKFCVNF